MPRVQAAGPANIFVILLCASQVYASCEMLWDTSCSSSFSTQKTVIGLIVGGAVLMTLGVIIRIIRHRRFRQRNVLSAYSPAGVRAGWAIPNNSYGRPQSTILRGSQMNSWSQPLPPPFPQPSYSSPMTAHARTQPPTVPTPTRRPRPNQTPSSTPDSSRLPGGVSPLPHPHASPLPHSPHSSPPELAQVSAGPFSAEMPSSIVTTAASSPSHPHVATSIGRHSPPENMEMHSLRVNTEAVNDEPPPAYTPT